MSVALPGARSTSSHGAAGDVSCESLDNTVIPTIVNNHQTIQYSYIICNGVDLAIQRGCPPVVAHPILDTFSTFGCALWVCTGRWATTPNIRASRKHINLCRRNISTCYVVSRWYWFTARGRETASRWSNKVDAHLAQPPPDIVVLTRTCSISECTGPL